MLAIPSDALEEAFEIKYLLYSSLGIPGARALKMIDDSDVLATQARQDSLGQSTSFTMEMPLWEVSL